MVVMPQMEEMAGILEMVRMAEKVGMADFRQRKMMEIKGAHHHLTKRAVLVHSKTQMTIAQPQRSYLNTFQKIHTKKIQLYMIKAVNHPVT